ncbi:unnamed protein product [Linum trigynum]|uniref:Uncharacterized protein n=1 Tax=Linum trigynum TaxID=586398 RepID=A0AAV2FQS3_9ROSI
MNAEQQIHILASPPISGEEVPTWEIDSPSSKYKGLQLLQNHTKIPPTHDDTNSYKANLMEISFGEGGSKISPIIPLLVPAGASRRRRQSSPA